MDSFNTKLTRIETAKNNIKQALINKGAKVGDNIEDYSEAINNIESGSGDVKLFETEEAMQADPTAKEGDLAVVYREEIQSATVDSRFQIATFPETVVLDEAVTDYIDIRYRAIDDSVMFDCMGSLDSSRFMMDCYTESGEIRIEYTSEDGITYTRTDTQGNPVDFGTEIYYEMAEMWNDAIGKFIQIGGSTFEGLYQYGEHIDKNDIDIPKISNLQFSSSELVLTWNRNNDFRYNIDVVKNAIADITSSSQVGFYVYNDELYTILCERNDTHYVTDAGVGLLCLSDDSLLTTKMCYFISSNLDMTYKQYKLVDNAFQFIKNLDSKRMSFVSQSDGRTYYVDILSVDTSSLPLHFVDTKAFITTNKIYMIDNETNPTIISSKMFTNELSFYSIKYNYVIAPSQLSVIPEYVYEKEFYGKNGVEIGTLTQNVSNLFNDTNAELYIKIQNQYDNLEPRVLTDDDKTIDTNIYCIPVKKDGTSLLDTSNVTAMDNMFISCSNLTTIPLLDTSKVTTMFYMFYNCSNLITIPLLNTSKVTDMRYMFMGCKNLITIPLLNTSKVTDMLHMFEGCTNLTEIPQLDTSSVTIMQFMFMNCTNLTTIPLLDTSNVIAMSLMFQNCTNLTTIPLLNTGKVTDMHNMFGGCLNLTDESLNNILAMCTNAIKITKNKTLAYIGLTQEQATRCQSLSNYSAFTSAGWTIGY